MRVKDRMGEKERGRRLKNDAEGKRERNIEREGDRQIEVYRSVRYREKRRKQIEREVG